MDNDGYLWIGSVKGLYRYNTQAGSYKYYPLSKEQETPDNCICSMYKDKRGTLWIGTKEGLFSFDPKNGQVFQHFTLNQSNISNKDMMGIWSIKEDKSGDLWLRAFFRQYTFLILFQAYEVNFRLMMIQIASQSYPHFISIRIILFGMRQKTNYTGFPPGLKSFIISRLNPEIKTV